MAQASEALDLGKLQQKLRIAESAVREHKKTLERAKIETARALANEQRWRDAVEGDEKVLDMARKAVLDGARSVTQG